MEARKISSDRSVVWECLYRQNIFSTKVRPLEIINSYQNTITLNIETNIFLFIFLSLEQVSNVQLGVRITIHAMRFDGKKIPMAFFAA